MVEEHLICSLCLVTATLPAVAGLKPTFASGDQCHSTCGRTHAPRQQQGNGDFIFIIFIFIFIINGDSTLWMPKSLQGGRGVPGGVSGDKQKCAAQAPRKRLRSNTGVVRTKGTSGRGFSQSAAVFS